jgi:Cu/Ag efflux pump CusA
MAKKKAKKAGTPKRKIISTKPAEPHHVQLAYLRQKEKFAERRIKRIFFTLLDALILIAFIFAIYFTYYQDYVRTILFLSLGILLLMFFIVRGELRKHHKK